MDDNVFAPFPITFFINFVLSTSPPTTPSGLIWPKLSPACRIKNKSKKFILSNSFSESKYLHPKVAKTYETRLAIRYNGQ